MISSEVQRTLVKSPPELWAEISDPESLARHLGEFGEIRITRVQPEHEVEWEADDASGTVAIKPSGWGTKVKLTVQRELALDAAGENTLDAAGENASDDRHPAQQLIDDRERIESEAAVELEAAAIEPEPREPEAALEAALEPDVEPEAALEAALEPDVEPEAALEPDVDATAGQRFDDEGGSGVDLDGEREPALAAEVAPAASAPTRRSFFARLFGWRRAAPAQPDAPQAATPDAAEHAADETTSGSSRALAPPEALGDSAGSLEPAAAEAATGASGAHDAARCSEPDGAEPVERVCVQPVEQLGEVGDKDAAAADDDAAGDAQRRDAAAELAAAEEVAVEQVAAVLSGVLDRLGAAHHRPFSRS